jgi:DNA polymerase-3 subunit epsilon
MGLAQCPCDGGLDEQVYAEVVDQVITAIAGHPEPLLTRLEDRVGRLAVEQRYEEAAWARDRYDALVRALQRNWQWHSLTAAGWMELEHCDGTIAVVDHGRLVETRPAGTPPRLRAATSDAQPVPSVAPSVETAEETAIIWRWLEKNQVRLVECSGLFAHPIRRVEPLTALSTAA